MSPERKPLGAPRPPTGPKDGPNWRNRTVELLDGRQLGIAEFGPEVGFPILWFHGTPGARRQVPAEAGQYAHKVGVRIIGVERPGVGRSTPHAYDRIVNFADDIAEVLDQLSLPRVGVIGLSGGGPYTLAVCAALPERVVAAAVLGGVAPSVGRDSVNNGTIPTLRRFRKVWRPLSEPVGWAMTLGIRGIAPVADKAFDVYVRLGPQSDREFLARPQIRQMLLDDLIPAGQYSFRAMAYDALLFTRHWGFDLADVSTPIYFWHGDRDEVIPLEHGRQVADRIPRSKLRVVAGEGHLSMLDAAEDAIDEILSHR